jgi:MoaD family protein
MPVQVRIPAVMQELTGGETEVASQAATVDWLIDDLDSRFPGMHDRLLDGSGLRRYINVYVNARDIRYGNSLATELSDGDVVWILPTSSGGMAAR